MKLDPYELQPKLPIQLVHGASTRQVIREDTKLPKAPLYQWKNGKESGIYYILWGHMSYSLNSSYPPE